jgi:hypothetical protein
MGLAVPDEVQPRDSTSPPALEPMLGKRSRLIWSCAEGSTGGSSCVPRASLMVDPRRCWLAGGGTSPGQRRFSTVAPTGFEPALPP